MLDTTEARSKPPEVLKSSKNFDDLSISEVDPFNENNQGDNYQIVFPIKINGVDFQISFKVEKILRDEWKQIQLGEVEISIFNKDTTKEEMDDGWSKSNLCGIVKFDFRFDSNEVFVTTMIQRNWRNDLPPSTGVVLYKKMLDFIAQQSQVFKKDIVHIVTNDPRMGLKTEKWLQIFGPILKERGYDGPPGGAASPIQNWEKVYKFQADN